MSDLLTSALELASARFREECFERYIVGVIESVNAVVDVDQPAREATQIEPGVARQLGSEADEPRKPDDIMYWAETLCTRITISDPQTR